MSDFGFKITLPGYDIQNATPEQCVLSSKYASPKIKLNQNPSHFGNNNFTFNYNTTTGTYILFTVNHNIGYIPKHLAMVKWHDGFNNRSEPLPLAQGVDYISSYTTNTQLVVEMSNNSGANYFGKNYIFKYYIFVENGI